LPSQLHDVKAVEHYLCRWQMLDHAFLIGCAHIDGGNLPLR
jgi:hypothetical protein